MIFFMYVDTLNEKLASVCIWLFFLSLISYIAVVAFKHTKTVKQKRIRILTYSVFTFALIAVAFISFDVIKEIFNCFI